MMLEDLLKGLVLWIYGLILEGVEYLSDSLLDVFSTDLTYFESYAPIVTDIQTVVLAVGWALLSGSLVFQAMRSMASGIGFEGEDPRILFSRNFAFAFLLFGSRQICAIGFNFTSRIMDLLRVPDAVKILTPDEHAFPLNGSWLLAMLVGIILIVQIEKFFFEVGERYVVMIILAVLAPLAIAMRGSKNTENIMKGWCRLFASMCVMMLIYVIFIKLLLSALGTMPNWLGISPWLIFVTAIVRVGRKIDDIVCRLGLNPAHTGAPLRSGLLALPMTMASSAMHTVVATAVRNRMGTAHPASGGAGDRGGRPSLPPPPPGPGPMPNSPPETSPSGGGGTAGTAYASASGSSESTGQRAGAPGREGPAPAPTRPPIARSRVHGGVSPSAGGKPTGTPVHPSPSATPGGPAQRPTPGAAASTASANSEIRASSGGHSPGVSVSSRPASAPGSESRPNSGVPTAYNPAVWISGAEPVSGVSPQRPGTSGAPGVPGTETIRNQPIAGNASPAGAVPGRQASADAARSRANTPARGRRPNGNCATALPKYSACPSYCTGLLIRYRYCNCADR